MRYFVYILRTSSNTLYTGQTNNLQKRLQEHKSKNTKSAKYIRYFSSFTLVYSEKYSIRKEAMRRELQLKKWSKAKKEALVKGDSVLLKKLQNKARKRSRNLCVRKITPPKEYLSGLEIKYFQSLVEYDRISKIFISSDGTKRSQTGLLSQLEGEKVKGVKLVHPQGVSCQCKLCKY